MVKGGNMAHWQANYKVHVRGRYVYFATLEAAKQFCADVFEQTGIVLSIVYAMRGE
jgi:hypothetical protein